MFVGPPLLERALREHGVERLAPLRGACFAGSPEIVGAVREIMLEHSARLPGARAVLEAAAIRLVHLILRALLGVRRLPHRLPEREGIRRAVELMSVVFSARSARK